MSASQRVNRKRRRSESPGDTAEGIRDREYYLNLAADFEAEEERRSHMSPQEKAAEDGLELQSRLDDDPALTLLLQPTPPRYMAKAQCYANYCFIEEEQGRVGIGIRDNFRAVLTSTPREYFHIDCLEKMLDLPSLAVSRFNLDMSTYRWNQGRSWSWGLMLWKWFEHHGRIDVDKIAEYIRAYDRYKEELADYSTEHIEWQLNHLNNCQEDRTSCDCPPSPADAPIEPTLQNYETNEGDTCLLSMALRNPHVAKLPAIINVSGILL